MRVITGSARGMKLFTVEGPQTRPTSDWTKESIEALSRGAASCVFVDNSRECVYVTQKNVDKTGFHEVSVVEQSDYRGFLKRQAKESFSLIFLDPPYGNGMLARALETIYARDLLAPGGLIVCEGERNDILPVPAAPYEQGREYFYGKTKVSIIRKGGEDA